MLALLLIALLGIRGDEILIVTIVDPDGFPLWEHVRLQRNGSDVVNERESRRRGHTVTYSTYLEHQVNCGPDDFTALSRRNGKWQYEIRWENKREVWRADTLRHETIITRQYYHRHNPNPRLPR